MQKQCTTIENLKGCIKLIGKNPQSAKDRIELGDEALQENDPERAIVEYSEAMEIDPASMSSLHAYYVPSLLSLAFYYAAKGKTDKSISLVNQALENMDQQAKDEQAMTKILLKDCYRYVPIREMLVEQNLSQSEYEGAAKELAGLSPDNRIQYWQQLAAYYEQKGDLAQADIYYAVMLGIYKDLKDSECNESIPDCLFSTAVFRDKQKQYKEAAFILSSAIEKYLCVGWIDNDFKKYMSNIEGSIKQKWDPPQGNTQKHTVVYFQVYRDGYIDNIKIMKSSNDTALDKSALSTLKVLSPLPLLPPGSPSPVDIEFTFNRIVDDSALTTDENKSPERMVKTKLPLLIADFQKLKRGMSREEVVRQVGEPDADVGSGLYIYVYHLADGSDVLIGCSSVLMYLDHIAKDGFKTRLIAE